MNLENEILQLCFDVLEKEITPLEAQKEILRLLDIVGQSERLVCDVCGSTDVIEAPHMGRNCNRCHPL